MVSWAVDSADPRPQPGDYRRKLPRQGRRQDSTLVRPVPHGSELRADPVMLCHRLSLVEPECQIEWPPPTDFVVINVTGDAIIRGSLGRISLRVMAFAAFPDGGHEHVNGLRTSSCERVTCGAVFPIG